MIAVQPLAAQVGVAPACQALGVSRASFYRRQRSTPGHRQPRPTPARALCEAEREQILDVLAGPRFVDRAPAEVVATLLDEGHYLCSERTMYRILAADQPVRERRNQREHPQYTKPELVATAPNQTWSWDITKLLGPTKWTYFYLYVVLDIFSRYAVGWMVADRENSALAGRLIEETCHNQGVQPQVLTLSAQVIGRLKAEWEAEHERWRRRDLSARRYVYMWADGIYLQGRLEDEKQCILVLIGATPEGRKELVGFQAGVRESAQSWRELLACLRGRGLTIGPELAIGDGALGFWKALEEIFPDTRRQRCWVHKTANVLNKLAKSRQTAAKAALHNIWMADGRAEAERAMNTFAAKYDAKYPQAVACLTKDRDALLAFYDFPAEHWRHIRTTNPIESVFATVRHRTVRTKGCLSHGTTLAMVFKLITTASKTWRRLMGNNQLPKVIEGVRFKDGMQIDETKTRAAA